MIELGSPEVGDTVVIRSGPRRGKRAVVLAVDRSPALLGDRLAHVQWPETGKRRWVGVHRLYVVERKVREP